MNAYEGLIILICGFVLGDIAGLNRYLIKQREKRKRGIIGEQTTI